MRLNTLKPAKGSKSLRKRVGRGIGSGVGKTCGRGHKGQSSRAGGYHKVGFEGGQMPLQRRIPKIGVTRKYHQRSVYSFPLDMLAIFEANTVVDVAMLQDAGLISRKAKVVKLFFNRAIKPPLQIKGIRVTRGAKVAIESVGGSVEA